MFLSVLTNTLLGPNHYFVFSSTLSLPFSSVYFYYWLGLSICKDVSYSAKGADALCDFHHALSLPQPQSFSYLMPFIWTASLMQPSVQFLHSTRQWLFLPLWVLCNCVHSFCYLVSVLVGFYPRCFSFVVHFFHIVSGGLKWVIHPRRVNLTGVKKKQF